MRVRETGGATQASGRRWGVGSPVLQGQCRRVDAHLQQTERELVCLDVRAYRAETAFPGGPKAHLRQTERKGSERVGLNRGYIAVIEGAL